MILLSLLLLICPVLCQPDNSSPAFSAMPINLAGDAFADHHILPMILNPGIMSKAGDAMVGTNEETWWRAIMVWMGNSSENSSLYYA